MRERAGYRCLIFSRQASGNGGRDDAVLNNKACWGKAEAEAGEVSESALRANEQRPGQLRHASMYFCFSEVSPCLC